MEIKCGSCQFWEEVESIFSDFGEQVIEIGVCRRHAPSPVIDERLEDMTSTGGFPMKCQVKWPVVEGVDWCGEWEEKED